MNIMDANPIRRGLKQLQKDDQAARVKELKRKQLQFYKKQKVCETFSTISIISGFGSKYHTTCLLIFSRSVLYNYNVSFNDPLSLNYLFH